MPPPPPVDQPMSELEELQLRANQTTDEVISLSRSPNEGNDKEEHNR